jgi:cholesterol transport system auxiliary component
MKRRVILISPLAIAGCASVLPKQAYRPRIYWPLDPQPPRTAAPNQSGRVVLLRNFVAGPGMTNQSMQTLNPDGSLTLSYYNLWATPPADAASGVLASWLLQSGAFAAVVPPASRLNADLIVEGELTELVADLGHHEALAAMTLVVIENHDGTTRPRAQQRIIGRAPLSGTGYEQQAEAENAALASAMAQAVNLVTRYV